MPLVPRLSLGIARAAGAVRDLVLPPRCAACDGDFDPRDSSSSPGDRDDGVQICQSCRTRVPRFEFEPCPRCLAPLPRAGEQLLACRYCFRWKPRFTRALALGPYEGLLRDLVLRNKIDATGVLSRALAGLAWERLGEELRALQFDVVAAPPMHWRRRWQQGFNPQAALARQTAARLRAPADPDLLRLRRDVPRQVGLSHAGRLRNLHGEMELGRGRRLAGARVLVVDDILTSGATCSEAARVLLAAGASEVAVLVVARTPPG
ncbi:MAG: ComF family protein [Pirellulales bacterium]|nr:ComF family protein [Pirellulales bacterium]